MAEEENGDLRPWYPAVSHTGSEGKMNSLIQGENHYIHIYIYISRLCTLRRGNEPLLRSLLKEEKRLERKRNSSPKAEEDVANGSPY